MFFYSFAYRMATLAAVLFCRMLGVFIVLPVAAPLVASRTDGGGLAAGLVLGGYGLTQALMQIPVGMLADRFGKKPVLLAALALFTCGGFTAGSAETVAGVIGGRLLQGAGAVAAVITAWIADAAPPQRLAPAMAAFGAVIALAFVLSLFAAPFAADAIGLAGIFYLSGWLGVAAFMLVLTLPATPPATCTAPPLFVNRALLQIAAGAFVLHYALATLFFVLPTTLAMPPGELWRIYAPGFTAALAPALWMIMRVEKAPTKYMSASVLFVALGMLLLPAATDSAMAVAVLFFFFTGFMTLEAALPALTAKAAPTAQRAAAMGIVMTCQFAGMFGGGVVAGALAPLWGGIITLVCLLLAAWFVNMRFWRR